MVLSLQHRSGLSQNLRHRSDHRSRLGICRLSDRKPTDWEAVEREYRAGVLPVREIANGAGISHVAVIKRAKRCGWSQNLAGKVKEEIAKRLVTATVTSKVTGSRREIVEAAALRSVDVILAHRKEIAKLRALASGLSTELEAGAEEDAKERLSLKERASILDTIGAAEDAEEVRHDHDEIIDALARKLALLQPSP